VIINAAYVLILEKQSLIIEAFIEWLHGHRCPRKHACHLDLECLSTFTYVPYTLGLCLVADYDVWVVFPEEIDHPLHQVDLVPCINHFSQGVVSA
jgi:hypothetical protein